MTNEEKALELGKKYETPCHGIGDCEFEARQSALEMAEWKDEGFLEWLKEIDTYTLKDKSKYIKLAIEKLVIEKLKKKGGEK